MRALRVGVVALIVGLFAGFGPMFFQNMGLSEKNQDLERRLVVSTAHSRLSMTLALVETEEWQRAIESSSKAFDSVEIALGRVESDADSRRLLTARQARDEITAGVAKQDPEVAGPLRQLVTLLGSSL